MNVASVGRTVILVLALFLVLAGINAIGRMSIPIVERYSAPAGAALKFVF